MLFIGMDHLVTELILLAFKLILLALNITEVGGFGSVLNAVQGILSCISGSLYPWRPGKITMAFEIMFAIQSSNG